MIERDWRHDRDTNQAVARAVGFKHSDGPCDRCLSDDAVLPCVPDYLNDWEATGPLIDRYGISLMPDYDRGEWRADWALGPTPMRAVVNVILDRTREGRLSEWKR